MSDDKLDHEIRLTLTYDGKHAVHFKVPVGDISPMLKENKPYCGITPEQELPHVFESMLTGKLIRGGLNFCTDESHKDNNPRGLFHMLQRMISSIKKEVDSK